jgi:CRP/FNR family transcriptional regulator, nitrogen fixation regulation protein
MTVHAAIRTTCPPAGFAVAQAAWSPNWETTEPFRAAGTVVQIPQGREIFAEGDQPDVFYKVVSGVVRICKFLSDGRRQIVAFHLGGEVFGYELGTDRQLAAEAVSDCTLICYRRRGIELMAQKDQTVSRQLLQYAMQNLAQAQAHSLLLARRGAAEKVACFLLDWQERSNGDGSIHLAMTRQEIADYLALTIETVSRSFSQFERDGVIALPNTRDLRLLDTEALEEMAA